MSRQLTLSAAASIAVMALFALTVNVPAATNSAHTDGAANNFTAPSVFVR